MVPQGACCKPHPLPSANHTPRRRRSSWEATARAPRANLPVSFLEPDRAERALGPESGPEPRGSTSCDAGISGSSGGARTRMNHAR
eukprot:7309202-Pyramimonas_sp.AAC.1